MRRPLALLLGLCGCAGPPSAPEVPPLELPADVFYADDPSHWGDPEVVVTPEYPTEALKRGQAGYVDVDAVVSPLHQLVKVRLLPDSPASQIFVESVRQVIGFWTFRPLYRGNSCEPSEEPINARIWFEVKDGTPSISVSRDARGGKMSQLKPLHRTDPVYPTNMARAGRTAYVYAGVTIDAKGDVVSVATKSFDRSASTDFRSFENSVKAALAEWRFPPDPQAARPRLVCYDIVFNLRP